MGGYYPSADATGAEQGMRPGQVSWVVGGAYEAAAGFAQDDAGDGWGFAEEMMRRMGEEFEPDSQFMEESWTMGVAAAEQSFRERREGAAERERQSQAFREMDSVGARAFAQASEWYAAMRRAGSGAAGSQIAERELVDGDIAANIAGRDRAAWLQQCAEEPFGGWREREPVADGASADAGEGMTLERAMRLLGLTAASTREQVRAAYRKMAGAWHPDRVASGAEAVRQAATEQMAEINEAYRVLRSTVS